MSAKDAYIVALVQELQAAKGLTFEQGWNHVLASSPDLLDGSAAAGFNRTPTKDPRVHQELSKHGQLEQIKKSAGIDDHVKRLAAIRELMAKDPSLSFDQAFTQVCRDEAEATAVAVSKTSAASLKDPLLVMASGSPDDLLEAVQAIHPEWSEARCEEFCWQEYWT